MDVSDDWISLLGGWYQKGTACRYVETAERRIRVMQDATAAQLRGAYRARDVFDEGKLFHDLAEKLAEQGVERATVEAQVARLRWSSDAPGLQLKEVVPPEHLGGDMIRPDWSPDPEHRFGDNLPAHLLGRYSVSIGRKSGHRCLHLLGSCHRVPELHYQDYEILEQRPDASAYHAICQQCFPASESSSAAAADDAEDVDESSSSDEE